LKKLTGRECYLTRAGHATHTAVTGRTDFQI
jgi:hypothetical protein